MATGKPRNRSTWVSSIVGVATGVILVVGYGPSGVLLPRATVCQLGSYLGTYAIWTPGTPLNKPVGVNVSAFAVSDGWNFTFSSGSLTVGSIHPNPASGGGWGYDGPSSGVALLGSENNWSFYETSNVSEIGSASQPCTQPYVAELGLPPVQSCGGFVTIPLSNNTSDVVEPHVWTGGLGLNASSPEPPSCPAPTPGAYIWFDTSFHENATGVSSPVQWNLCSLVGNTQLYLSGVAEVPVVVYALYDGHEISTKGFETWVGPPQSVGPIEDWTAYWSIPGGYIWTLAPVGPTASPIDPESPLPSLIAFERSAC